MNSSITIFLTLVFPGCRSAPNWTWACVGYPVLLESVGGLSTECLDDSHCCLDWPGLTRWVDTPQCLFSFVTPSRRWKQTWPFPPPPQFMFKIYSVSWVCGLVCYIFWLKDIKDGFILDLRTTAIREMIMLMSFLERKGQSLCDWPWRILLLSLVISYSLILVHYWGWNSKTKLMIKFSITTELGDMGHLEYQSSSAL